MLAQNFKLFKDEHNKIRLFCNDVESEYKLEPIEKIKNTNIEYLKYSIPLLKKYYYDVDNNLVDVEIENISKKHIQNVTKALNLIKPNNCDSLRQDPNNMGCNC